MFIFEIRPDDWFFLSIKNIFELKLAFIDLFLFNIEEAKSLLQINSYFAISLIISNNIHSFPIW